MYELDNDAGSADGRDPSRPGDTGRVPHLQGDQEIRQGPLHRRFQPPRRRRRGRRAHGAKTFGNISAPLPSRCGNWHGRIGFGEQVQNDIGDGSGEMPQQFKKLWTMGMTAWLKKPAPGDVLPFCSELGPPLYTASRISAGREISDRWQQSQVHQATGRGRPGPRHKPVSTLVDAGTAVSTDETV